MELRPPEPADDPFLAYVQQPEVAGEFNTFASPAKSGPRRTPAG